MAILRTVSTTLSLAALEAKLNDLESGMLVDGDRIKVQLTSLTLDQAETPDSPTAPVDVNLASFLPAGEEPLGRIELVGEVPPESSPEERRAFFDSLENSTLTFICFSDIFVEGAGEEVVTCRTLAEPTPPSVGSTLPSVSPTLPSVSPTLPSVGPTPPSVGPTPPSVGPTPPSVGPTPPSVGPTPPSVGPTPPSVGPTPPSVGPTPPSVGPTPPSVGPTPPSVGPTPPSVGPTPPSVGPKPPNVGPTPPNVGPTRILHGDGMWPFTAEIVGDDIVVHDAIITCFGGNGDGTNSDPQDDGGTASGLNTNESPVDGVSIAMDGRHFASLSPREHAALDGAPIPRLRKDGRTAWNAPVEVTIAGRVYRPIAGIVDLGPGKQASKPGQPHALDLSVHAVGFFAPQIPLHRRSTTFSARGSFRIIGGARLLA